MNLATQIKGLKEERGAIVSKLETLAKVIQTRAFNTQEQAEYDQHKKEIEGFNSRLSVLEEEEKRQMAGAKPYGVDQRNGENDSEERSISILKRVPQDKQRPISDWVLRNFDVKPEVQKASVYNVLACLATGKTGSSATRSAMDEVRSVTGTALLGTYLSAQLWDGGISKSVCAKAGMQTIPLLEGTHSFPRIDTYPTFQWSTEGATTTDLSAVFSSRTFTAKTLRGFVRASGEMVQDGINFEQTLKQVMDKSAANAIDTAALIGSGSGAEPKGIKNYANANTYVMGANGAAITNYDPFFEVTKNILDDNGAYPTSVVMSPREWKTLGQLKEGTTNAPLPRPPAFTDLNYFETSKIPVTGNYGSASGNISAMFFGDFTNLYLGSRLDISVMVSPVVASVFSYDFMLAFRGDILPDREENFGFIDAIKP